MAELASDRIAAMVRRAAGLAVALVTSAAPAQVVTFEAEPNETRSRATLIASMSPGDELRGSSGGASDSPGAASLDLFRVLTTPGPAGSAVYRYRLEPVSTPGGNVSIRGLNQSGGNGAPGVISTADRVAQTANAAATGTLPARTVQWFGFGAASEVYVQVTGTSTSPGAYALVLRREPVALADAGTVAPGSVRLRVLPGTATQVADTAVWVLDTSGQAVAAMGNDDPWPVPSVSPRLASVTRTMAAGEYLVAVAPGPVRHSSAGAADDAFVTANARLDFPRTVVGGASTPGPTFGTGGELTLEITHAGGVRMVPINIPGAFEVGFARLTVGGAVSVPPSVAQVGDAWTLPEPAAQAATLSVRVTPGASPASSGAFGVVADLSGIGLGTVEMLPRADGVTFDLPAGLIPPSGQAPGTRSVGLVVRELDSPWRTNAASAVLNVGDVRSRCAGAGSIDGSSLTDGSGTVISMGSMAHVPPGGERQLWQRIIANACGTWTLRTCPSLTSTQLAAVGLRVLEHVPGCSSAGRLIAQFDPSRDSSDSSCAGHGTVRVAFEPGREYSIVAFVPEGSPTPANASAVSVRLDFAADGSPQELPEPPPGDWSEWEPNGQSWNANSVLLFDGAGVIGRTTGGDEGPCAGPTTIDRFRVQVQVAAPIARVRAMRTSTGPQVLRLLGARRVDGQQSTDPATLGESANDGVVWYTLGQFAGAAMDLAVSGPPGGPGAVIGVDNEVYRFGVNIAPVTMIDGPTVGPGALRLRTEAPAGAVGGIDAAIAVLNPDGTLITGWTNEDAIGATDGRSAIERQASVGQYIVAVALGGLAHGDLSAVDEGRRDGTMALSSALLIPRQNAAQVPAEVVLCVGDRPTDRFALTLGPGQEIAFVRVSVDERGPGSEGCSPADIANTDGEVPPDGRVDNGDFALFFIGFFADEGDPTRMNSDIADTDGQTRGDGGGPDGTVDNGDFSAFFVWFFEGCG